MPFPKRNHRESRVLLCLFLLGSGVSRAATDKNAPTTWWPDPATGLIWTGKAPSMWVDWQQASDACAALRLAGFSDWRLPTFDEIRATVTTQYVQPQAPNKPLPIKHSAILKQPDDIFAMDPYHALVLKGGVETPDKTALWTSTPDGQDSFRVVFMGQPQAFWGGGSPFFRTSKRTDKRFHSFVCTRSMEPDLLQVAKDAQVASPLPDLLTLKASVPLNKAKLAYQAGEFQDSVTQAQNALAIKPDFVLADWAIGISYGRLGQWDKAIASLEAALNIDKHFNNAKTSLKWAKEAQEAAQKGKSPKSPTPEWN